MLLYCTPVLPAVPGSLASCLALIQRTQTLHASYRTKSGSLADSRASAAKAKRPLSAYNLYIQERVRGTTEKMPSFIKQLADEWEKLPSQHKVVYESKAAELRSSMPKAPAKGPAPVFAAFVKEKLPEVATGPSAVSGRAALSRVAELWRQLPAAEKQARVQAAAEARRSWLQAQQGGVR